MIKMPSFPFPSILAVVILASGTALGTPVDQPKSFFRTRVELRQSSIPSPSVSPRPTPRSAAIRQFNLQPAGYTPYDPYLDTVRRVLRNVDSRPRSLAEASKLLRVAYSFRYETRHRYRADLPSVTAVRKAGDCKAKALWLYDRLGDTTALYVIGKVGARSRSAHAWLYWRWNDRWWILDPTNLKAPIAADTYSARRYIPYYSFDRTGAYRHPATHLLLFAKNGRVSEVAERKSRR